MSDLPKFVSDDPTEITQLLLAKYEAATGKPVRPGQVDRLLIDTVAYSLALMMAAINDTGRQSLVRFARAPMLDYLGELVGVYRLPAQPARTTVRLNFATALDASLTVPAGTRVESSAGIQFATAADTVVAAGVATVDLAVLAVEPGTDGNGLLPAQITALVDELSVDVNAVVGLDITAGGSDEETDDRLRVRIMNGPEAFSVGGPAASYRERAMAVHQDIVAVGVGSPEPGLVALYPLMKTGLPTAALLDDVAIACSDEKFRPLSDTVQVLQPVEYAFTLSARLELYDTADAVAVLGAARTAAAAYKAWCEAALGLDVVPSQIEKRLSVDGVYDITLLSPAAKIVVPYNGWAHCTAIDVQLVGVNGG